MYVVPPIIGAGAARALRGRCARSRGARPRASTSKGGGIIGGRWGRGRIITFPLPSLKPPHLPVNTFQEYIYIYIYMYIYIYIYIDGKKVNFGRPKSPAQPGTDLFQML